MAEALPAFVARRRPDWTALEQLLARQRAATLKLDDVAELDRLYRRASSDLATAQAAYAGTDVHRFLNQLCATAWAAIYRPRGDRLGELRTFYGQTFPQLVRETLPLIQLSALVLALGAVLGAVTVLFHPDGAMYLVPADIRGWIARHELWTDGVLGVSTPGSLAVGIFLNNVRVMLVSFIAGISAGVLTLATVLYNGLFTGAVVAACFRGDLGWNIVTFMSAHGPVELSLICIAAGAGLRMGRAVIDPGERSRRAALAMETPRALRLMLGAAPFMVAIGIVEGFVSPGAYFPTALKVLTGAATFYGFWRWLLRPSRAS